MFNYLIEGRSRDFQADIVQQRTLPLVPTTVAHKRHIAVFVYKTDLFIARSASAVRAVVKYLIMIHRKPTTNFTTS